MSHLDQTLGEYILSRCSESLFAELAIGDAYWGRAMDFFEKKKHYRLEALTINEKAWANKIKIGLIEEAGK